ncbi:MAG: hypothetical protein ACKOWG_04900, partial [Planctomycetia bacterium]
DACPQPVPRLRFGLGWKMAMPLVNSNMLPGLSRFEETIHGLPSHRDGDLALLLVNLLFVGQ